MAIIPQDEKVFMVSKTTNTTYSGSKALKEMAEYYTMQDVTDTIKPYKVFTALLSQYGGNYKDNLTEGSQLDFGQSYFIDSNPDNYDLTIYGAPNSNEGTWFICNDPTNPIIGYSDSLLITVDYGAPVVTVLENTIGNVWFSYDAIGSYLMNSSDLFTNNFTFVSSPTVFAGLDLNGMGYSVKRIDKGSFEILSFDSSELANSILDDAPIEVRVYNH